MFENKTFENKTFENKTLENAKVKSALQAVNGFLCDRLESRHIISLSIYFAIISILELVAYSKGGGIVTDLAARIWLTGGVFCFATIIYYFVYAMKSDIAQKNTISLIGIIGAIILLYSLCGNVNYTDINPDATQQAVAGLNSFLTSDFNYIGKAFLGYPNRQYVLVAIPALLFGRSIFTLQFGFAFTFILGIISMYSGLRQWADKKGVSGKYAIIAIFSLFAFRYVTEYYTNFEQAILPISITMIMIGLFLNILCKPNVLCIISTAWIGCLCSNSYTPVLASLGLLFVFVALLAMVLLFIPDKLPFPIENKLKTAIILFVMDANILLFFIATLLDKRADRVNQLRHVNMIPFTWTSIYEFLIDKNAVFMGFMGIIVIIYMIASLTRQLKIYNLLLSLWVLGVIVAANLMLGYTEYAKAWVMQRALIIIPVLIIGISLTCYDFIQKYNININNHMLVVVIIALVIVGRYNLMQKNQSFAYSSYVQPMKYMLNDLEKTTKENGLSHTDPFNFVMYTDNTLMHNLADYFNFLYPNAKIYYGTYGKFPENVEMSKPTFIYGETNIANMTPSNDIKVVEYYNYRYAINGSWYKTSIVN